MEVCPPHIALHLAEFTGHGLSSTDDRRTGLKGRMESHPICSGDAHPTNVIKQEMADDLAESAVRFEGSFPTKHFPISFDF